MSSLTNMSIALNCNNVNGLLQYGVDRDCNAEYAIYRWCEGGKMRTVYEILSEMAEAQARTARDLAEMGGTVNLGMAHDFREREAALRTVLAGMPMDLAETMI